MPDYHCTHLRKKDESNFHFLILEIRHNIDEESFAFDKINL